MIKKNPNTSGTSRLLSTVVFNTKESKSIKCTKMLRNISKITSTYFCTAKISQMPQKKLCLIFTKITKHLDSKLIKCV